ncbi:hypothetical protein COEREDRAFT_14911 [Coemansia reversa NRRL 1564]|uniref:Uncharacterized protein n=1 Tax=Coemansia reversa (strain ATCC 12441 / NRRL 1564) TaxID=763665 RepID=A0A2G5BDH1_COERN|nr:hypothetical protein COEREDRAFT_14911 [Coemansia reversa NRRL 1564]|eukprot:PIA17053.1 hypothetical protein COEREDRAFT_14911 [Coemansia reversa NRRL 1564]
MEYLKRILVFRAAPQKHSPVCNVAQIAKQYHASNKFTRVPPALGRQQFLKTPPTNQGFIKNNLSSIGCLCDRRLQSQQQQHSRTAAPQRDSNRKFAWRAKQQNTAILAPPETPTHPDERRELSPDTHTNAAGEHDHGDVICSTASSVTKKAIDDSDTPNTSEKLNSGKIYSPWCDSKSANPDAEVRAMQDFLSTELMVETSIECTREKLALFCTSKAARLKRDRAGSP